MRLANLHADGAVGSGGSLSTQMALLFAHGKTEPTGITVEEVLLATNPSVRSKTRVIYCITALHNPITPFLSPHEPLYS